MYEMPADTEVPLIFDFLADTEVPFYFDHFCCKSSGSS